MSVEFCYVESQDCVKFVAVSDEKTVLLCCTESNNVDIQLASELFMEIVRVDFKIAVFRVYSHDHDLLIAFRMFEALMSKKPTLFVADIQQLAITLLVALEKSNLKVDFLPLYWQLLECQGEAPKLHPKLVLLLVKHLMAREMRMELLRMLVYLDSEALDAELCECLAMLYGLIGKYEGSCILFFLAYALKPSDNILVQIGDYLQHLSVVPQAIQDWLEDLALNGNSFAYFALLKSGNCTNQVTTKAAENRCTAAVYWKTKELLSRASNDWYNSLVSHESHMESDVFIEHYSQCKQHMYSMLAMHYEKLDPSRSHHYSKKVEQISRK